MGMMSLPIGGGSLPGVSGWLTWGRSPIAMRKSNRHERLAGQGAGMKNP